MPVWKIGVRGNVSAVEACHSVLVRAETRADAEQQALVHARLNDELHNDPVIGSVVPATEQEALRLQAHEEIMFLNISHFNTKNSD